jgi:hypothetical protein
LRERGHPYMGFLGASPFCCENPRFWAIGFPWISGGDREPPPLEIWPDCGNIIVSLEKI